MKTGWIKLHRQIQDCPLWYSEPFTKGQAWIDLLMNANHEDGKIFFDNQFIEIKRGQYMTSIRKLSVNWKWSVGKTKRFIERLSDENMLNIECLKNGTLLTLVNYDVFQGERNTNGTPIDTPTEHQRNTDGYTDGTPIDTPTEPNKNVNNEKNIYIYNNAREEDRHFENEKLNESFNAFLDMRYRMGKPPDEERLKRKLFDMTKGKVDDMIQILENSITGGWSSLVPLKEEKTRDPTNRMKNHDERKYNMGDLEAELSNKFMKME